MFTLQSLDPGGRAINNSDTRDYKEEKEKVKEGAKKIPNYRSLTPGHVLCLPAEALAQEGAMRFIGCLKAGGRSSNLEVHRTAPQAVAVSTGAYAIISNGAYLTKRTEEKVKRGLRKYRITEAWHQAHAF